MLLEHQGGDFLIYVSVRNVLSGTLLCETSTGEQLTPRDCASHRGQGHYYC